MRLNLIITAILWVPGQAFQFLTLPVPSRQQQEQQRSRQHNEYNAESTRTSSKLCSSTAKDNEVVDSSLSTQPNARYEAINALLTNKGRKGFAFAIDRLEASPDYKSMSLRDRAFARLLVSTVLRRQGQIDKVIAEFANGPKVKPKKKSRPSRIDIYVQNVLRLGAAQLLFLHTPAYAACQETVELLRMNPGIVVNPGKIKYANAILRTIVERGPRVLEENTSVDDNAAPWLFQELVDAWGEERATQIVEQAMHEAPRCLTVRQQPGSTREERDTAIQRVAQTFGGLEVETETEILNQGSIRMHTPPPGSVSSWPGFEDGNWFIQNPSATLPAIVLFQTLSEHENVSVEGMHVVDMCAAPGGKTLQLSSYGFDVTAVEVSSKRIKALQQNFERLDLSCHMEIADGRTWVPSHPNDKPVRGILLDAPCTATGTGSSQPDVLRKQSNYTELVDMQYELACHLADNVLDTDGVLVYSTCSLLCQEGEDQMKRLLARSENDDNVAVLETIPIDEMDGLLPGCQVDENGWLRVFPEPGNYLDGFFVAQFRKVR